MNKIGRYLLIVVATYSSLLLAACGGDGEGAATERAAVEPAAIGAEASASLAQAPRRVDAPAGFPVPFTTYVPEGIEVETVSAGEGDGIRFTAGGAAAEEDEAFVNVFFHPAGTTEDAAGEVVRAVAEAHGPLGARSEVQPTDRYPWAIRQFRFREYDAGPVAPEGWVALGRHGDRFFHVIVQYPPALEDEFLPRARTILDRWQWTDTGEGLGTSPGRD